MADRASGPFTSIRRTPLRAKALMCCIALFAGLAFPAGTATAATGASSSVASFGSGSIDLQKGWGQAKACVVWHAGGVLECFTSDAALAQAEAALTSAGVLPDVSTCGSALNLYSGTDYTGLHLAMYDRGYWQELSAYGFADTTKSFIGGACGFHLANGSWGSGYWYPGNTGPYSYSPNLGSWNDTIQSVYIE